MQLSYPTSYLPVDAGVSDRASATLCPALPSLWVSQGAFACGHLCPK